MQKQPLIHSGSLSLADGSSWAIEAEDSHGADTGKLLAECMQLSTTPKPAYKTLVLKNGLLPTGSNPDFLTGNNLQSLVNDHRITCQLEAAVDSNILAIQLLKLSLVICSEVEARGGLLVHGALAEKDGFGVILAGPGNVGKTTASKRLPPPWRSLCDDTVLVVKDRNETYHAHPWPTWSTFMFGGSGSSWDVQHSVPLRAIFLLSQNKKDHVEPLGQGKAVCLIDETAEQAWHGMAFVQDEQVIRDLRQQRFNSTCDLVKTIPAFQLHVSRDGKFWKKVEQVL